MKKIIAAVFISLLMVLPARAEYLGLDGTLEFMKKVQVLLQQTIDELRADATPEQLARWPKKASMEFVCTYIHRFVLPDFTCLQVFAGRPASSPSAPSQERA